MIKTLPVVPRQTEHAMQHIVEVTTNARAAHSGGLGGQVQRLPIIPDSQNNSRQAAAPRSRKTGSNRASMPRLNAPSAAMSCWQDKVRAKSRRSPRPNRRSGTVGARSAGVSQSGMLRKAYRKASSSAGARSQRYMPGSSPVTRCTNKTRCNRGGNGHASNGGADVRGSVASSMARTFRASCR